MRRSLIMFVGACGLLLGARMALSTMQDQGRAMAFHWSGLAFCSPLDVAQPAWQPELTSADLVQHWHYRCGEASLSVHVAQYFEQGHGKEAVSGINRILGSDNRRLSTNKAATGLGFDVRQIQLADPTARTATVWHWYGIGPKPFVDPGNAKLQEVFRLLTFRPAVATVFVIRVVGDQDDDSALLGETASAIWGAYQRQTRL